MQAQFALSWRLAFGSVIITLVMTVLVLLLTNVSLTGFDETVGEAMGLRVSQNANQLGKEILPLLSSPEQLVTRLEDFRIANETVFAIVVQDAEKNPLGASGEELSASDLQENFAAFDKPELSIGDNLVVGLQPLWSKDKAGVSGYLYVVESKKALGASKSSLMAQQFFLWLLAVALIGALIFFVGRRTAKPLIEISEAAQRIADGQLHGSSLDVSQGASETKLLATSVKKMTDMFRLQIGSIKELISEISTVSKDAASAMAHLASSAAEQAAAVSETASTVEEMEQAGKSAAGNANEIVEASSRTTEVSIRGRQAVETTSRIILQIKDSSQEISERSKNLLASVEEIGNIISSVNAIAEQSKILAVNASIEAAKAGEYGVGFAVVAQEVKELAQQSKEATLEITGTLTAIRQAIELMVDTAQSGAKRTEDGVKMVGNAGAIVNDLSEAIRENSDFANVIATNVSQQSLGLTQIAAAIDQINSTALENQEITKKVEQSTKQMTGRLDELDTLIGMWKTETGEDGGPPAPKPEEVVTKAAPEEAPAT